MEMIAGAGLAREGFLKRVLAVGSFGQRWRNGRGRERTAFLDTHCVALYIRLN